jgi:uncharacterized protein
VNHLIPRLLALMLAFTAVGLLLQEPLQRWALDAPPSWVERVRRFVPVLTILTGLMLGVGVALTSVGAGALGTVALFCLYPRRLTPDRLVATDIAHALPVTLVAATGHATLGHLNLPLLGCLLLGSIPSVLLTSRLTIRLPPRFTRILIAIMLALVSARMLLGT